MELYHYASVSMPVINFVINPGIPGLSYCCSCFKL